MWHAGQNPCIKGTMQGVVTVRHLRKGHTLADMEETAKGNTSKTSHPDKERQVSEEKHRCLLQLNSECCYMFQIRPYKLGISMPGESHNLSSSCF